MRSIFIEPRFERSEEGEDVGCMVGAERWDADGWEGGHVAITISSDVVGGTRFGEVPVVAGEGVEGSQERAVLVEGAVDGLVRVSGENVG